MKTKDRILQESISLFAENGFESTSMTDIANVIGITKPSIYAHYKNKLDLFIACLRNITTKQCEYVESILNDESLKTSHDMLFGLLNNCSTIMDKGVNDFYYRFYFFPPTELKEIVEKEYALSIKRCNEVIIQIVTKGIENGEIDNSLSIDDIKNSYNCLMDGLSCKVASHVSIENVWNVFWRGIKA